MVLLERYLLTQLYSSSIYNFICEVYFSHLYKTDSLFVLPFDHRSMYGQIALIPVGFRPCQCAGKLRWKTLNIKPAV